MNILINKKTSIDRNTLFSVFFIALLTFSVYFQLSTHDFLIIDDSVYVTNNQHVKSGLNLENIVWAFTSLDAEFWHPITWISYMVDTELFGEAPGGYLFTNLIIHLLNSIFLFYLMQVMTGKIWESFLIAALFSIHPMHVEVVAWISERKELLCAFFWILATLAYYQYSISYIASHEPSASSIDSSRTYQKSKLEYDKRIIGKYFPYIKKDRLGKYLLVLLLYLLGLMSKSMIITLPFTFLLLDFWPLKRKKRWSFFVIEKIPFFVITIAGSLITLFAQGRGGGLVSLEKQPFIPRIVNSVTAYALYIKKIIWPRNLSIFYPLQDITPYVFYFSIISILALSIVVILCLIKFKIRFPLTGWLWFMGTLVPVIGIIKIGDFAMADRYTYIPSIGLFIIFAFGMGAASKSLSQMGLPRTPWQIFIPVAILACYLPGAYFQVKTWKNSESLLSHSLRVSPGNFLSHHAMGEVLARQGKPDEALIHFYEAVRLRPDKAALWVKLGRALAASEKGGWPNLDKPLKRAQKLAPENPKPHFYLLIIFLAQNNINEAMHHLFLLFEKHPVLKMEPDIKLLKRQAQDYSASLMGKKELENDIEKLHDLRGKEKQNALRKEIEAKLNTLLKKYDFIKSDKVLKTLFIKGYDTWNIETLKRLTIEN